MSRSNFIVFDGLDCSGKSTAMNRLKLYIENQGLDFIHTREPGGTPMAESIREEVLEKKYGEEKASNETRLLLMFASRNQNVDYRIKPALDAGKVVLSDRFSSSTYAYQIKNSEDEELFELLHSRLNLPEQPLTIIFDVNYCTYTERKFGRQEAEDNIEQDTGSKEAFTNIRNRYLGFAKTYHNCHVIDANGSPEAVFEQIMDILYEKGFNKPA